MTETLRDATAADLEALLALQQSCFAEDPWTRGMLEEELRRAGGIFIVLGEPGRPIGFAIGWAVLDDLHVLQVAVRPDLRRQGLGRRLMDALVARAPYAETGWLEVRRDNEAAIGLYEALGFRGVGIRPRYYNDGCDAFLFRKGLRRT
jgi:ribosomal-protein-alanine acetyltransferase